MPPAPARIRVCWENPFGTPRLILETRRGNQVVERPLGPRGILTLDQAAAVLERPRAAVLCEIRAGLLRPVRRRGRTVGVTVRACAEFLAEQRQDLVASRTVLDRVGRGRERLIPWDEARRRL
jgi:hypothetical protein